MLSATTNKHTFERIIVIGGGVLLLFLILSSWFPRNCSLLRSWAAACPVSHVVIPETSQEKELARIPHQTIEGNTANFAAKSQDFRGTTAVKFSYWADTDVDKAYLMVNENGNSTIIALITHPLLAHLNWPRVGADDPPVNLYQRTESYSSVDDFWKNPPPADQVAVDNIIATNRHLDTNTAYHDLDSLKDLNSINYIVTTYTPPAPNGSWLDYNQTFDLQKATPDTMGNLQWSIFKPINKTAKIPFLLSPVHIDYKRMQP